MILIGELLLIAVIQTVMETLLDAEERKKQLKVVNLACIAASYMLLARFVYTYLIGDLFAFVGF